MFLGSVVMQKHRIAVFGLLLMALIAAFSLGLLPRALVPAPNLGQPATQATATLVVITPPVPPGFVGRVGNGDSWTTFVNRETADAKAATYSAQVLAAETEPPLSELLLPTATLSVPVPITEAGAISYALAVAPEGSGPFDPVARRVTYATMVETLGWMDDLSPEDMVWIVAVRTTSMASDTLGRRLGIDPTGLMTPVLSPGYLVVVGEMGLDIGMGNLASEESEAGQRYSVISGLTSVPTP